MKNYEKYKDKIRMYEFNTDGGYFCNEFIMPHVLKSNSCAGIGCEHCHMLQMIWLLEDYEEPKEPEIDWSKIKVDTPILVKAIDDDKWKKRYFAKYENGIVYAWDGGKTSWNKDCVAGWKYAKLAGSEEE